MDGLAWAGLGAVAGVAFLNGANDVSRSIATLIGSGVHDYRKATILGTVATTFGAALSGWVAWQMVKAFTQGWFTGDVLAPPAFAFAVALAAVLWLSLVTGLGFPVSTTHSLVGALLGGGIVAYGASHVVWQKVVTHIFLPLAVSPLVALAIALVLHWLLSRLGADNPCLCVGTAAPDLDADAKGELIAQVAAPCVSVFVSSAQTCRQFFQARFGITADHVHIASAILVAFARALNDTPKIVALGVFAMNDRHALLPIFGIVTVAMGLGSWLAGYRVTQTLAERVTRFDHRSGLAANLTTSLLVSIGANWGLPMSTTHVSGGAIIGVGISKGAGGVYWDTVLSIVLAWCVTLPACGLVAAILFRLFGG